MPKGKRAPGNPRELAGKIRASMRRAIEQYERDTKQDFADFLQEWMAENPRDFLRAVSEYLPKEVMIEQDVTHRIISGEPISADEWQRLADDSDGDSPRAH